MHNVSEVNQELVKAFNINLRFNSIVITNLTVQNLHGKDHIVISFDKNMDSKQCMKYLNNMKEKIIKRSYRDEKAAGVSYNLKFFPFAFNMKHLPRDNRGRKGFSVEIDEGVFFNLKCYLAQALAGDVTEGMGKKHDPEYLKKHIYDISFDRSSYLYCMLFHDKGLQKDFVDLFSAEIEGYPNPPSDYLEENDDLVYIKKGIFDNVEFIKDIAAYNTSLECRYLQTPSTKNKAVDKLKYTIIDFMDKIADIPVRTIIRTSHNGNNENSVLIPIVAKNRKDNRFLDNNDAYEINSAFGMEILSDVGRDISMKLSRSDSSDSTVYGIDFSEVDIACCVLNKIIESSVINKDHELSIDPELRFRALSPVQSPFNSPTHAEPPRTPPNQRKEDGESGYESNSPPKSKDSGAQSQVGMPNGPSSGLTELPSLPQRLPTRSRDGALKGSARQGSEKEGEGLLYNYINLAGTSKGFSPLPQLNSIAVNSGVSAPSTSSQSLGAAKNVQATTSAWTQPMGAWSFQAPSAGPSLWSQSEPSSWPSPPPAHENKWTTSTQFTVPGGSSWPQSGPLSWPSPPPAHENKWTSSLPFTKQGSSDLSWTQKSTPAAQPQGRWSLPPFTYEDKLEQLLRSQQVSFNISLSSKRKISEEEEKLIKALLYVFNLDNSCGTAHTNFILKNGEIVGLFGGGVDIGEYLEVVKESHCDKKAEKVYDLDKFPFAFPPGSNNEEDLAIVADDYINGTIFNLKIHLIKELKEDVEKDVVKELEKMKITENRAYEYIRSVRLEKTNDTTSYLCGISFSNEGFQGNLFQKFKSTYVKAFKLRLNKCGLNDSLVDHVQNTLYIKDAIDINVVTSVEKYRKEEDAKLQASFGDPPKEASVRCFPYAGALEKIPIVFEEEEEEKYLLDRNYEPSEVCEKQEQSQPTKEGTSVAGKGESDDKPLTEEEQELFEKLLYAFNYTNKNFERPDTNFIVKNGKIVSLLHDNVDVKEYLKKVIDKAKEEYCKDKKEVYDLDEFPFKFLSNCEKNQETTVVANISRGALFNLEKLFIYGYEEEVKIEKIDVNIVKEKVESKKRRLVKLKEEGIERETGYRTRITHREAVTASYPDESALERIPIRECGTIYYLDRDCLTKEVKSFIEDQLPAKGTSKAGEEKPENNDSGISSGEATDAENVSSKAEATTSGCESMDCENTGGGSPKRKSRSPEDGGSPRKSPKREIGSPYSNLSDSDSEILCKRFHGAKISK